MSLFVDVIEVLSSKIKSDCSEIIESERKNLDRPIRKICDNCMNYLKYGELRYDKMEDGIRQLKEISILANSINTLLLAILNESLDEDAIAVNHFMAFADSSMAENFHTRLSDFIIIGRFVTLKESALLENAGNIIIERYSDEDNITELLTNLYLKDEKEEYIPVFQQMLARAKEKYPTGISLESLNGFMHIKAKDYAKALESFLAIKDRLEQDTGNQFYNENLYSTWDNIAGCYLKMGDAAKAIESCDLAAKYDNNDSGYRVGNPILVKKARAYRLQGENDQARTIADQLLAENPDDAEALEIKGLA